MKPRRSLYGRKALFIALMVILSKSSRERPNVSAAASNSWLIEVWLISRLSVFSVTRNFS
jgi:hypothetical protein